MQTAAHRMQRGRSDLTVSAAKKVWCPECVSGTIFFTKGQVQSVYLIFSLSKISYTDGGTPWERIIISPFLPSSKLSIIFMPFFSKSFVTSLL